MIKANAALAWMLSRFGRSVGRRFLFEWIGTACAGIVLLLACVFLRLTTTFDNFVYDFWLEIHPLHVSPSIVLVDIDDASIEALGRWPWPRDFHAELANRLADDGASAVVYDILFTEPSAEDVQLAQALGRRPSFLPILLTPADTIEGDVELPVTPLARQADGLGHINLEADSDGIVRSVALYQKSGGGRWPQLMVPVANAIRDGTISLPGQPRIKQLPPITMGGSGGDRVLIPFSSNAENYQHVSFVDVLAGRVPADVLKNRIVLVGVTASGLYEHFATPLSGELGSMPGVYVHADVLDMLMNGTMIHQAAVQWIALASLAPLVILLAGLFTLTPSRALILMIALVAASFAASAALLVWGRIWLSPVPVVIALLAVFLVWNWRRLEMTMGYLREKLHQFADEPYLLGKVSLGNEKFGGDPLAQQMALMTRAIQQLQDMRRFVWDSLDNVPELVFVADSDGTVRFINREAREHFAQPGVSVDTDVGRPIQELLGGLSFVKPVIVDEAAPSLRAKENWPALLDPSRQEYAPLMAQGIEVRDEASARDYILRYARHDSVQNKTVGWIACLFDISALHHARRQREEALQLLSHDMRSPQASILTLIEGERKRGEINTGPMRKTMEHIESYARRTILLAENFVHLARAESEDYKFETINFSDLLFDASDEVWPQAQVKHIQINMPRNLEQMAGQGWVSVDRSMMTRALVNILNNAVKYSPPDTEITCSVHVRTPEGANGHASLVCAIQDQGYGMTVQEQARLFEPFRRFHTKSQPQVDGLGLGMTFVRAVVSRHEGDIAVVSEPGKGTTITISLPVVNAPV